MASAYTPSQVNEYLQHIGIDARYHDHPALDIDFLTSIHVHHISAIPYENLILHYSAKKLVSLDSQDLYEKIVTNKRCRGGYCMENALLLHNLLRALGFSVYMTGARVRPRVSGKPSGKFLGWVHAINIVTLSDGSKWMLDVGFGGDGPTKPMSLVSEQVAENLGPQEARLLYGNIDVQTDKAQKLWIYQYRNGLDQDWNDAYCFPGTELEFTSEDFEVMNYFTSTNPRSIQTTNILIVKYLISDSGTTGAKIVGKVMLIDGEVKRNLGGKTQVVMVCRTEEERVQAFKDYFEIMLTEEERIGIIGTRLELAP